MQTRAIAAQVLTEIIRRHRSLNSVLPAMLDRLTDKRDKAFVQELCYGVLRWYYRLDSILQPLLEKDLKPKDADIKSLILLGLYQLDYLRTPPHAAVSATVDACDELHKPWARKLVNALLRRYQKESKHILSIINKQDIAKYAHPPWLLELLQQDYPDQWTTIVEANNQYPPMFLRINARQTTRSEYLDQLEANGIQAVATALSDTGIRLTQAVDVNQLPGFEDGLVSVQDLSAQLTFNMLNLGPDMRVLDACAAPGGKIAHILEQGSSLDTVVAIEKDSDRFERLQQNMNRLRLSAQLHNADAGTIDAWSDGTQFDRILLDVPCSATGVIRRHPDIKILRQSADIGAIVQTQAELLSALWPLLKTGGKLLYVTCSVLTAENDCQIKTMITKHRDAKPVIIASTWGNQTTYGLQILPGENDMDGFYYACLEKI